MSRISLRRIVAGLFGVAVLLIVAGALGLISARFGSYAIVAAVTILAVGLASTDIGLIPVMALPATLLMMRVGGALSVSDVVLAAAALPAVLLYKSAEAEDIRPLIWLGVIYQAALLPGLLLNPYRDNIQEWVHELFLVLGSLVVGWVVGRRGQARTALNIYILGCTLIGVWAFVYGLYMLGTSGTFGPVYLPFLHKNFIGNALAYALLLAYVRPDWLGWSKRLSWFLMIACAAGIAASNSRQAILSVAVAVAILSLRSRQGGGGRGRLLLLALVPAVWYVGRTVYEQLTSDNPFNSTSQRLTWFVESLEVWQTSPIFGVGLRWWYSDRFNAHFQPPNAFLEMLTSAGVVGLLAFIVMCAGGLWVVFRLEPRYGNAALAVMIARFCQGQLDLYWVAGQASIPWLMAGLAFGVKAHEQLNKVTPGSIAIATRRRSATTHPAHPTTLVARERTHPSG
jgi:polysaccharide biosynthesis protein PslJ